jgi:hypothetical protein
MLRLPIWMIALGLVGCFGSSPDNDDDDDDDWGDESDGGGANGSGGNNGGGSANCDVEGVSPVNPEADGAEFYYRGHVQFVFDGIDEDATLTVTDGAGAAVDGSTSWDENTFSFAPSAPLANSTQYSATLIHCAGESTIGFMTGALGGDLAENVDLTGKTYVVELDGARFVKPAGVGGLLMGLLEQNILLGVTEVTDSTIRMMGAISETDTIEQDRCEPSINFPEAADFTAAPFFSVGPQDTTLSAAGYDIVINNLMIAGDFSADASYIGGAILSGLLDARDLVDALVGGGLLEDDDPNAVCDLIATFGVACGPCPDGENYCLEIYVDQITAQVDDQTLVAQDECDPDACAEGCDY